MLAKPIDVLKAVELVALLSVAVWRLSALLTFDYGPWNIFERLRAHFLTGEHDSLGEPMTFIGSQLDCFWCTTLWVAIPFAVAFFPFVLWGPAWLSLSGVAILLSGGGRVIYRGNREE